MHVSYAGSAQPAWNSTPGLVCPLQRLSKMEIGERTAVMKMYAINMNMSRRRRKLEYRGLISDSHLLGGLQ